MLRFTVIVIGCLHWVEACHTFHSPLFIRKHEVIVHSESGMEFPLEERDWGVGVGGGGE